MTQVTVGENEGIESALRRFKRQVSKAGIFADLKRLRHHETPVEKYKRKAQQRRRRRCFGRPQLAQANGNEPCRHRLANLPWEAMVCDGTPRGQGLAHRVCCQNAIGLVIRCTKLCGFTVYGIGQARRGE